MHIWVDADACPNIIKEVLFKTAIRREISMTLVANAVLSVPSSPLIDTIRVSAGFDVADDEIARLVQPDDLVITADIPLADKIVDKGARPQSQRRAVHRGQHQRAAADAQPDGRIT